MGEIRQHEPVLLFVAAFSRYREALRWARDQLTEQWGPLALESAEFRFTETRFYQNAMGDELIKVLWAFSRLFDPAELPGRKRQANRWEQQYAAGHPGPEPRPLNLDPGYVTEAKLVLASTKDRDHRIYLSDGIFAENTLYYRGCRWQSRPWTYPDYQRADYHQFLEQCRDYYRNRKQARGGSASSGESQSE